MARLPRIGRSLPKGWTRLLLPSSIQAWITAGFAMMILILAAVVAGSAWLQQVYRSNTAEMELHAITADHLEDAQLEAILATTLLQHYIVNGDDSLVTAIRSGIATSAVSLNVAIAQEEKRGTEDEDELARLDEAAAASARVTTAVEEMIALRQSGDVQGATSALDDLQPTMARLEGHLTEASEHERDEVFAHRSQADRTGDLAFRLLVTSGLIGGALGLAIAALVGRSILRPLSSLQAAALAVADGDLETRAESTGPRELASLGTALNQMADSLLDASKRRELEAERERAHEQLRESEERTRLIVETAHDAFIAMDANGVITAWNAQAERTFGWSRSEAIGRKLSDTIIPPQHGEAHERGLERFLATGEGPVLNKSTEITACHHDGREFPVELAVWVVGSGETCAFNAFVRDITERKRAEEALRESEERFRKVFEEGPLGMALVGSDLGLVKVNPALCQMLGYTEQELTSLTFPVITHPEDIEKDLQLAQQVFNGEIPSYNMEKRYIRKNGEIVWVDLTASAIPDQEGKPLYGLGIVQDITERKRAEEALRDLSRRDPLTGVLNHAAIVGDLGELVSGDGDGASHAVAMIDVDGMKATNDTYGHQVGDTVLLAVAGALARDGALVGRYGGDEFLAILPGADRESAERYRQHVQEAAAGARLTAPETGARVPIVVSIGLAIYPDDAEAIEDLIKLSDSAMYASRRQRPIVSGPLSPSRLPGGSHAAEMVGQLVPLLTSPAKLEDKLRLVSHRIAVGAGYDAVNIDVYAKPAGLPHGRNVFAQVPDEVADVWRAAGRRREDDPFAQELLRTRRAIIVEDPQNDERLTETQREVLRAAQLRSAVVAPLFWGDEMIGTLSIASKQEAAFTPRDVEFLTAVATQIAAIVHTATLVDELQSASAGLRQAHSETVMMLAAAAEAFDTTTGRHLQSVRAVTEALARELGYSDEDARELGLAAVLHDIGKIRVPDSVLCNPGKLAAPEWEVMKQHSIWGHEFLTGRPGFDLAATIARSHHERWDGSGYPDGLSGEDIPEAATIVAVADSVDAMTDNRPYRAGRSLAAAVREVVACSGSQFNPRVVEALVRLHKEKRLPISPRREPAQART